jgi:cyclopropane fatty-acyl-phospholipid synthase-like methyltransferase
LRNAAIKDPRAARYAQWAADGPVDTTAVQHLQHLVERLPPGARVLDLGCGDGDRWPHQADQFTLTGVDLSFQQLLRACEVLPHARLVQADMTRLELQSAAFDAVVSLYAFNHLPFRELPHVLTRIARWLRPGGLMLANMGTSHNPGTFETDWLGVRMYFSGYPVDRSQAFVRAVGYQIQSARKETLWETIDGRPMPARFLWILAQRPVT